MAEGIDRGCAHDALATEATVEDLQDIELDHDE
jgi:hypothetical protein